VSGSNHSLVNATYYAELEIYGISGKFLTLIQSYLRDRYQKVLLDKINVYDSVSSRSKKVTNGVPQGFILGLLFFFYSY
jgi:hypothetical protein